jgi:hypothetical protein
MTRPHYQATESPIEAKSDRRANPIRRSLAVRVVDDLIAATWTGQSSLPLRPITTTVSSTSRLRGMPGACWSSQSWSGRSQRRSSRFIAIPATGASGRVERLQHSAPIPSSGHNKVYEAPRELIGAALTEMPRHADRGLCCGAGGARMWMEEHIGKRVNHERVDEALATDATKIATGCPFCRSRGTPGRAR